MSILSGMLITNEDILRLKALYFEKNRKRLSDQEATDILQRLINLYEIIKEYESGHNLRP